MAWFCTREQVIMKLSDSEYANLRRSQAAEE